MHRSFILLFYVSEVFDGIDELRWLAICGSLVSWTTFVPMKLRQTISSKGK